MLRKRYEAATEEERHRWRWALRQLLGMPPESHEEVRDYLRSLGYDPDEIARRTHTLVEGILESLRQEMPPKY